MDFVTSYKEKLAHFRLKDLKDILTQLGLSKQGKKQDLADRILTIILDDRVSGMWAKKKSVKKEEVAKLVDDMHRKLQVPRATDVQSKSQNVSNVTDDTTVKEEVEDTCQLQKVRCICGSTLQADSMTKCEDKKCNVQQHVGCVIIPEKPMDDIQPTSSTIFYCELCRLARADPFWVATGHPLYPVKWTIASGPMDGKSPMQNVEKTFQLTKADMDLLAKPDFEIQAWCMLLNDKVSFRMQWPQYADLQVNGMPVRAINRPGSQLLGANGRDDGPLITPCIHEGSNKISLTGCDARVFCLGVRIMRRRTVQQILDLIPRESDGEKFENALARVCRCVGGGPTKENEDSGSDLEVVSDSIPVNLRCPMSGSRMRIAGRFKPCVHMGCFDLEVFVQMNQRSRKWQCPICLKNYSLEDVIIDPYFTRITTKMRDCGEDVTEIEVKPVGSWRVKAEHDRNSFGQLGQWHLPDGTLFVPLEIESKLKPEALTQVKHEDGPEGHNTSLKFGFKKNRNGNWEVVKHTNLYSLSSEKVMTNEDDRNTNGFVISSSGGKDGEVGGQFGHSTTGSLSPNPPAAGEVADVIVLSDSPSADVITEVADVIVFNDSDEETYDKNGTFWSLPSTSQARPGFEILSLDENVQQFNVDINEELVDNPLAFGHNDPSLQLFLPTHPHKYSDMDTLADTGESAASLLLGLNGKTRSRERFDDPFTDQNRSARPRLDPSIQTDFEQD